MSALGCNIDGIGAAVPSAVKAAGASWVRMVLLPDRDTRHLVSLYQSVGLKVLGVVARESVEAFGHHDSVGTWVDAAIGYRTRVGTILDAIQIGNESDHVSPSSWTLPAQRINLLAKAFHGFKRCIGPGLVSGHPEYVQGLDLSLFDALAVHPYGQAPTRDWPHWNFGYVLDLLERYANYGKPLWVTEYGTDNQTIQAKYVAEMSRILLAYPLVEVAFHFCFSDRTGVAPFGLLDLNDRKKAAYQKFYEASKECEDMAYLDTEVKALKEELAAVKRDMAFQEEQRGFLWDEVARILSGNWHEGAESAEALLRAINPKYSAFESVPFPK